MPDIDLVAVAAGTVAAFVLGGAYYAVLGTGATEPRPILPTMAVEVVRCLVLVTVVAGLASLGGVDTWAGGLALGSALWLGFPAVLWAGAIFHERTPWRVAALHAGDWLVKLVAVGTLVAAIR